MRQKTSITIGDVESVSFVAAIAEVSQIREGLQQGRHPKAGRVTFKRFFEQVYLPWAKKHKRSWRDDLHRVRKLLEALGHKEMQGITRADIQQVLDQLRCEGAAANSVANVAMLASTVFRVAVEAGVVAENPAKGVKAPRKPREAVRVLMPEEQVRLGKALVHAPLQLRCLVELILCLGLRIGEAVTIRFDHIDHSRQLLRLPVNKSGQEQTVPLPPRALKIVAEMMKVRRGDYLFCSSQGNQPIAPPYRAFRELMKSAQIEGVTWHTLRKTVATEAMTCRDVTTLDVSRLLRHQSIRTTEIFYLGTSEQRLRVAATAASDLLGQRLEQGRNLVLVLCPSVQSLVISPNLSVITAG